jgi:hypothetical protein
MTELSGNRFGKSPGETLPALEGVCTLGEPHANRRDWFDLENACACPCHTEKR